jgi:hypothetical protein
VNASEGVSKRSRLSYFIVVMLHVCAATFNVIKNFGKFFFLKQGQSTDDMTYWHYSRNTSDVKSKLRKMARIPTITSENSPRHLVYTIDNNKSIFY